MSFFRGDRSGDNRGQRANLEVVSAPLPDRHVRVFLSYAWEDGANGPYRDLVEGLAARLWADGMNARLDRWDLESRTIADFMASEVRNAHKILALCSPAYRTKVHLTQDGLKSTGSGYEAMLINAALFADIEIRKKLVLACTLGDESTSVPDAPRFPSTSTRTGFSGTRMGARSSTTKPRWQRKKR